MVRFDSDPRGAVSWWHDQPHTTTQQGENMPHIEIISTEAWTTPRGTLVPVKAGSKVVSVSIKDGGDLTNTIAEAVDKALSKFHEEFGALPIRENLQIIVAGFTQRLVVEVIEAPIPDMP